MIIKILKDESSVLSQTLRTIESIRASNLNYVSLLSGIYFSELADLDTFYALIGFLTSFH